MGGQSELREGDEPAEKKYRLGIIADTPLQQVVLKKTLDSFGLAVCFNVKPVLKADDSSWLEKCLLPDIDLILVEIEDDAFCEKIVDLLLDRSDCPVLFGLGAAPGRHDIEYPRWERRLHTKLSDFLGDIQKIQNIADVLADLEQETRSEPRQLSIPRCFEAKVDEDASEVWILAASLGGPEAVKIFLDLLPAGLPVAFLYAQHIDANFSSVLTKVLARHSSLELQVMKSGDRLKAGQVVLAPVEHEFQLDEEGRFRILQRDWPGPYGPSIDQVMFNIASFYGSHCHTIFFSGMGNDGAIAAPLLKAYGSTIWIQEPASCANSSMPSSVNDTGCVSFIGNPEQLARELLRVVEKRMKPQPL